MARPDRGSGWDLAAFIRSRAPMAASVHMRKIAATAIVLAVAAGGGYIYQARGSSAESFITAPVERGRITSMITATGTVNPVLSVVVGSYVSGIIQEILCDFNSEVKQGQVCAKIDPRSFQSVVAQNKANLAVAKAQLEKDKANLKYTKIKYDRVAKLKLQDSVPLDVFDAAETEYEQAQVQLTSDQATIEQREAELETAEVSLGYTVIVSPVDGIVISRNVTVGQTVASSFQTPTLFTIAKDLREMQVHSKIDEADIGRLRTGQPVSFTVDAYPDRTFAGQVLQIRKLPDVVQNVVTYTVVISAPNPDQALLPGMTANLRITVDDTGDVLKIPSSALRFRPKDAPAEAKKKPSSHDNAAGTVWVPGRNGSAVAVPVEIGASDESGTQLLSGDLAEGDPVIIGVSGDAGRVGSSRPRSGF
jgi:HlyD family secretion protein